MAEYRTQMKIIGDILSTTRDDLQDEDGATVTYLIRKANISHSRISRILKTLVSQGLLEQVIHKVQTDIKLVNQEENFCKHIIHFQNLQIILV